MELQTLKENGFNPNTKKFEEVKDSPHLTREWEIINEMEQGIDYYKYIIDNVDISHNANNSFVLWVCDKVNDINKNNPVKFNAGNYALPDIDVDFPPFIRDDVISYIKDKYGHDKVCQMVTFGKLAGKSIIKEVLRANESCSFDQMNTITSKLPNESAISDLLEEMDEPSVIRWTLEHDPDSLIDYCWLNEAGDLEGDYAREFEQALRMEGIFKTRGKHAAGVVISSETLNTVCPMIKPARGGEKIAGMEMDDLESIGCVKFDILGVNLLQKIMECIGDIENGDKSSF